MAIDKMIAPLSRVPLFTGLQPLQLTEIARHAERIAFRRGVAITKAGTPGDGAYLIVSGDAECLPGPGSTAPPQPVEPGSLVGELAMLIDHVYGATVIAQGRVHCLKITRAALYEQMQTDLPMADHFSSILTHRLTQVAAEMRRIDDMLVRHEEHEAPMVPTQRAPQGLSGPPGA